MLKEGIFLGKRYEILDRIGSGGMADVYKGKDHKLNRYVAIKVLKSDFRSDETFIKKFLSEAQAAAGLMHPNVVNVYDVGQDRGVYYMVMELVEGITLKEYIEKKGRLSAKETISISIQMVTGIQAAHNQHIIHRDIKPQNIIISKDGKVKVTDFGIARATTSSNTISTSVMGSVHYTSPEQARGGVVDEKSDIYSAGISMYEMVTGHVPFDGESTVTVAIKHLQEEIISPIVEVPDTPKSLEKIILKCTQKSPMYRYQNCEELLLDLKRALVDPQGGFISNGPKVNNVDETVVMDTQEIARVQNRDYDGEDYDDPDESYDDEEYDEDSYDRRNRREDGRKGKKEEVDPQMKKVTKILMIVVAVIVAIGVIFGISKAVGGFMPDKVVTEEKEKKVSVPDIRGMTEEEARKALTKKNIGYQSAGQVTSDKYEKGEIAEQDPKPGEKVKENSTVTVKISSGPAEKTVKVPDVTGKSEADAQKQLEDKGFVVASETDYSDSVPQGYVISTNPTAGTEWAEGNTVTMVVSMGKEKISVPNVSGVDPDSAQTTLQGVGLTLGSESSSEYSDEYEEGTIIRTVPAAGEQVEKGTTVNYVLSKGKKTETVEVPTLSGLTRSQAEAKLSGLGLTANVTESYDSTVTKGYVISQSVTPGSQIEKGATVDIVVSLGPENVTPDPPTDGDNNNGNDSGSNGGSSSGANH